MAANVSTQAPATLVTDRPHTLTPCCLQAWRAGANAQPELSFRVLFAKLLGTPSLFLQPCPPPPQTLANARQHPVWSRCVGRWPVLRPLKRARTSSSLSKNCSSPPRSGLPTSSWPPEASQSQVQRSPNPELHRLVVHGHTGVDGCDVLPPVALPGAVVQWVSPRLHRHHIGQQA